MEITLLKEPVKEKVSTILLSFLKKEKINFIFGIPGGYNVSFLDEFHNFPEIKFIRSQHEEGAAFMADGFAKASGKIGVVLSSAGPGLSNTLTGIISSYAEGVPVLLISGEVPKIKALKGAIQDTESIKVNILNIFKETTRFQANIVFKENFLQYFRNSIKYLFKGKRGPVFLNIASNVFSENIEHNYEYSSHYEDKLFNQNSTDGAIEILKYSKSVLVVAGWGVMQSKNARDELIKLVEKLKIPVIVTPKGKSSFNNESHYFLGVYGAGSSVFSENFLKTHSIDTVLAVGTSFNEFSSDAWSKALQNVNQIIQMDVDPYIIGRSYANTFAITGDAGAILKYMNKHIEADTINSFSHLNLEKEITAFRNQRELQKINLTDDKGYLSETSPLNPARLIKDIKDSFYPFDKPLNIFNDIGSCVFWLGHYLKLKKDWNYYISLGFSSMGYAIPASIGGALGDPSKITIAFAGDGGALMNGNELKTAAENNIPVLFFIMNDSRLGIIHHSSEAIFGKASPGTTYENGVDFVKFAESLGVEAYTIDSPGQINHDFIKEQLEKRKPILFDCKVDNTIMGPYGGRIKEVNK